MPRASPSARRRAGRKTPGRPAARRGRSLVRRWRGRRWRGRRLRGRRGGSIGTPLVRVSRGDPGGIRRVRGAGGRRGAVAVAGGRRRGLAVAGGGGLVRHRQVEPEVLARLRHDRPPASGEGVEDEQAAAALGVGRGRAPLRQDGRGVRDGSVDQPGAHLDEQPQRWLAVLDGVGHELADEQLGGAADVLGELRHPHALPQDPTGLGNGRGQIGKLGEYVGRGWATRGRLPNHVHRNRRRAHLPPSLNNEDIAHRVPAQGRLKPRNPDRTPWGDAHSAFDLAVDAGPAFMAADRLRRGGT